MWERWARHQGGPLTRRGPAFPATPEQRLAAVTGTTLAVEERDGVEVVTGFATWRRGRGYDEQACLEVDDLVGLTPDAHRALWRLVASFGSVTARVRLSTSGDDVARLALPTDRWPVVASHPFMLRLLDVPAALAVLPGAPVDVRLDLAVVDDPVGGTAGTYRVVRGASGTSAERVAGDGADGVYGADVPRLTPGGLALLWTGTQTSANLRHAGLLTGPTHRDDDLDQLALRAPRHVRNYF